jgi:hypothetical protein
LCSCWVHFEQIIFLAMAIEAVSKKDQVMRRFGKLAAGALMLAGTTAAATLVTTAPADAHISVGIGIGIPGPAYYGGNPCYNARYRYYHPEYCGYAQNYGQGYYGSGYYAPVGNGLWFTDAWGHRRWRDGESRFHGGDGDHGNGGWRGNNNRGFQGGERNGGRWNGGSDHQSGGRGDGEHDHGGRNWHH